MWFYRPNRGGRLIQRPGAPLPHARPLRHPGHRPPPPPPAPCFPLPLDVTSNCLCMPVRLAGAVATQSRCPRDGNKAHHQTIWNPESSRSVCVYSDSACHKQPRPIVRQGDLPRNLPPPHGGCHVGAMSPARTAPHTTVRNLRFSFALRTKNIAAPCLTDQCYRMIKKRAPWMVSFGQSGSRQVSPESRTMGLRPSPDSWPILSSLSAHLQSFWIHVVPPPPPRSARNPSCRLHRSIVTAPPSPRHSSPPGCWPPMSKRLRPIQHLSGLAGK